jgi:hypothetical protein
MKETRVFIGPNISRSTNKDEHKGQGDIRSKIYNRRYHIQGEKGKRKRYLGIWRERKKKKISRDMERKMRRGYVRAKPVTTFIDR